MEFKIEFKIEQKLIEDLIVSSLEGGSGYWMEINIPEDIKDKWNPVNYANQIINNNWSIPVFNVEHPEIQLGEINNNNLQRGLNLLSKFPYTLANIVEEDYDSIDADVFIQLVVMEEVIYG